MRHALSRRDYEALFGPRPYPTRTAAAASELVTRGLKANGATLDYLVAKGVIDVPQDEGGRRMWDRRHIDRAAEYLDQMESFTPGTWRHVIEDTSPAQEIEAFREACRQAPHLPPDPNYFVRQIKPGVPGLGIYATVSYRAMTAEELVEWHGLIAQAQPKEASE